MFTHFLYSSAKYAEEKDCRILTDGHMDQIHQLMGSQSPHKAGKLYRQMFPTYPLPVCQYASMPDHHHSRYFSWLLAISREQITLKCSRGPEIHSFQSSLLVGWDLLGAEEQKTPPVQVNRSVPVQTKGPVLTFMLYNPMAYYGYLWLHIKDVMT